MASQEDFMPVIESPSIFSQVIQEHLELKRRNAALEHEMPLERYMHDDPFENHPLFKTEEQARIEDTMDGMKSIVDEPTSLDWPVDETFTEPASPDQATQESALDPDQPSDENLWSRSRDFDWGD
jgi:hypothetical protein